MLRCAERAEEIEGVRGCACCEGLAARLANGRRLKQHAVVRCRRRADWPSHWRVSVDRQLAETGGNDSSFLCTGALRPANQSLLRPGTASAAFSPSSLQRCACTPEARL